MSEPRAVSAGETMVPGRIYGANVITADANVDSDRFRNLLHAVHPFPLSNLYSASWTAERVPEGWSTVFPFTLSDSIGTGAAGREIFDACHLADVVPVHLYFWDLGDSYVGRGLDATHNTVDAAGSAGSATLRAIESIPKGAEKFGEGVGKGLGTILLLALAGIGAYLYLGRAAT